MEKLNLDAKDIDRYVEEMGLSNMLSNIQESGKQAASIVNNMLTFSRLSSSPFLEQDMEALIRDTIALSLHDKNLLTDYHLDRIDLSFECEAPGLMVPCDPAQIQQVLMNLIRKCGRSPINRCK